MHIQPLPIIGAFELQSAIYSDNRGNFREWFKESELREIDPLVSFKQSNISVSKKNTIRGIHYSLDGSGQSKLVTCLRGSILDVAVDIRPSSITFGQYVVVELNAEAGNSIYLSGDLGHAFIALEEDSVVSYLLSSEYNAPHEHGISPIDPTINIYWPPGEYVLSKKDEDAPSLLQQYEAGLLPK